MSGLRELNGAEKSEVIECECAPAKHTKHARAHTHKYYTVNISWRRWLGAESFHWDAHQEHTKNRHTSMPGFL